MNIVFFHRTGIVADSGGISRITSTLASTFREHDHNVYLLAAEKNQGNIYDAMQFFLPDTDLGKLANEEYLIEFVVKFNISIIINQSAMSPDVVDYLYRVKCKSNVKIVSCIHNSILTQGYNFAYQKEYKLKEQGRGYLFKLLKTPVVKNLLVKMYILKNRTFYSNLSLKSDAIVLLHKGHLQELEKMVGNEVKNAVIIPNCLYAIPEGGLIDKQKTVLWVGRIDFSIKRIDYMLRIWQKVMSSKRDWTLQILGTGKDAEKAHKLANKLNLSNVEFVGQTDSFEYYRDASVVCVTSTHESFSLVTLEGMMNGCVPVLFNSFPAASLLVKNFHNGILIEDFNVGEFANELIKLMDDRDNMIRMSKNARVLSSKYTVDSIYPKWDILIGSLV